MPPPISQDETIQTAHAKIDALLSEKSTYKVKKSAIAKIAPQIVQDEAIQTAHADIDALLSKESTYNDVFPEEVIIMAKQLFERVYIARVEIFRRTLPRPNTALLIAAVIHAACRQCDGQSRTFNEMARLTGENVGKIEKFFFLIDAWLCSMNNPEAKEVEAEEVKEEVKEDMEEGREKG